MASSKREISFDLDTKALSKYYDNISLAYSDLRNEFERVGFIHRQGSVYNSKKCLSDIEVTKALKDVCNKLPWISECAKSVDLTNIGKRHSLLDDINVMCNNEKYFADSIDKYLNFKVMRKSR